MCFQCGFLAQTDHFPLDLHVTLHVTAAFSANLFQRESLYWPLLLWIPLGCVTNCCVLDRDVLAYVRKGLTHARKGLTHARKGLTHARKGLTHARKGLTHARKGLTHARKGLTHALKGLTHARKGLAHARKGLTHARKGLTHVLDRDVLAYVWATFKSSTLGESHQEVSQFFRHDWCSNLFLLRGHQPTTFLSEKLLKSAWRSARQADFIDIALWFAAEPSSAWISGFSSFVVQPPTRKIICSVFTNKNQLWLRNHDDTIVTI